MIKTEILTSKWINVDSSKERKIILMPYVYYQT